MGKQHYIEHLHEAMEAVMERPVTLGRAEEIAVYAEAICALGRTGGHEAAQAGEFTKRDAERWTSRMQNEDGTAGAKWTIEQTSAAGRSAGVPLSEVGEAAFFAAMNMIYSDYCAVARMFGIDRPDFYAQMAKAFLLDKDAGEPEEKIERYWRCVAGGR